MVIPSHPIGQNVVDSRTLDESVASAGKLRKGLRCQRKSVGGRKGTGAGWQAAWPQTGTAPGQINAEIPLASLKPLFQEKAHFRIAGCIRPLERAIDDVEECVLVRGRMAPDNVVRPPVVSVVLQS